MRHFKRDQLFYCMCSQLPKEATRAQSPVAGSHNSNTAASSPSGIPTEPGDVTPVTLAQAGASGPAPGHMLSNARASTAVVPSAPAPGFLEALAGVPVQSKALAPATSQIPSRGARLRQLFKTPAWTLGNPIAVSFAIDQDSC